MSRAPSLSIVVPTCGRAGALRRLLRALAATPDPHTFEVVIVADGVRAADTGVGDARAWPFTVTIVEQRPSGAAIARNTGAERAKSDLLLFLDDDVEPSPAVVDVHREFHRSGGRRIGIGGLTPVAAEGGLVGSALAGWWETMVDGLADPRHRYTFRDLLTGHCSISRAMFTGLGGFDASLQCHEDFEFGFRAIEEGVDVRFVADAEARHHDESTLDKILRRKWDEGVADVQLARKHPRLLRGLPLGLALAGGRGAAVVQRKAVESAPGHQLIPSALRGAMSTFERLRMRDKWRDALERAMDYWYWRGVAHAAGGAVQVRAIRTAEAPPGEPALDVDLSRGLDAVERQLDGVRPRRIRVFIGRELVGLSADAPGADRLRGVHLRPLLLQHMLDSYLAAAARAGLLSEVLLPVARQAMDTLPSPKTVPADFAA
jgi:GT2 family glycosyltransferase